MVYRYLNNRLDGSGRSQRQQMLRGGRRWSRTPKPPSCGPCKGAIRTYCPRMLREKGRAALCLLLAKPRVSLSSLRVGMGEVSNLRRLALRISDEGPPGPCGGGSESAGYLLRSKQARGLFGLLLRSPQPARVNIECSFTRLITLARWPDRWLCLLRQD
jgi:hypothetical protein